MRKYLAALLTVVMTITMLSACNKKDGATIPSSEPLSSSSSEVSSVQEEAPKPEIVHTNPMTGEAMESPILNRPAAVMVSNIQQALPQKGIQSADVLVEMPVEGAITRIMALFSDYSKVPNIGSIRSARHDFVELIVPFSPLYLHFGWSQPGREAVQNNNIDTINGIEIANVAFYQDKDRLKTKASEHTWFSNADYIQKGISKKSYKNKLEEPMNPIFKFAKPDDDVMATATAEGLNASAKLSNGCIATFDYDATTKRYKKGQYGGAHIDASLSGQQQLTVKNVLVMHTDIGLMSDRLHKEINLSSGSGYYLSNGKRIDVTFSKPKVDSLLKVIGPDGQEQPLNVGNTYLVIAPKS